MTKSNKAYKFFISYRRDDEPDFAEHIRSWFSWYYERMNVFMDFDSIPIGVSFPNHITEQIKSCDAMLVIIGPKWIQRFIDFPYDENDWVRIEIREAINLQKLVIPIYVKGAKLIDKNKLPPELWGMLNTQSAWLESGQNLLDRIENAIKSIEKLLDTKYSRKREIEQMEEISPAPGLALGYYVNFVKPVGDQIVLLNDKSRKAGSEIKLSIDKCESNDSLPLRWSILIPRRITFLRPEILKLVRTNLSEAEIQSVAGRRPFSLYAHITNSEVELVDFPTTVTVIYHWLKRRLEEEGLNIESEKALKLEEEELHRFRKALTYYIEDHSNDPAFRKCIKAHLLTSDDADFEWVSKIWK